MFLFLFLTKIISLSLSLSLSTYMCSMNFDNISVGESPCNPNPCQHGGQCTGEGQTYLCECLSGYSGDNCQDGASSNHFYTGAEI